MLARAIARSIEDAVFARIQCTPDLQPSDVTGINIYNQKTRDFEFRRGPLFANVVLLDEINRAMPKTQSALLEAMAERQVTFVAIDTSRSMLAASSASSRTRLERAQAIAKRVRAGLIDTPTGVGTFTDRPLPLLLPSSDAEAFTSAVEKAIGIERPPPRSTGLTISNFDAVAPIPISGYFRPGVPHKLLVLITDAESEDFDVGTLRYDFRARPRIGVVLIRVGGAGEQVFGPGGLPEPAYAAPPASGRALVKFLGATRGRAFGEHDVGGALDAARAALGTGPHKRLGTTSGRTDLAPYFVLAAVFPLGVVLRRRNF